MCCNMFFAHSNFRCVSSLVTLVPPLQRVSDDCVLSLPSVLDDAPGIGGSRSRFSGAKYSSDVAVFFKRSTFVQATLWHPLTQTSKELQSIPLLVLAFFVGFAICFGDFHRIFHPLFFIIKNNSISYSISPISKTPLAKIPVAQLRPGAAPGPVGTLLGPTSIQTTSPRPLALLVGRRET